MLRRGGRIMSGSNTGFVTVADVARAPSTGFLIAERDISDNVVRYLRRTGWRPGEPGPVGALWHRGGAVVAVPDQLVERSVEWRGLVERIAVAERRKPEDVALSFERELIDVAHLRAANDVVIRGSIPLQAGVSLVSSAWTMLRASATTSQRLRPQIGGNFSKTGDEIVEQARLGHTQEGSYVIPVLMRLEEPPPPPANQRPIPGLEAERTPGEPPQRRVMRTFAQALSAVQQVIVAPERTPTVSDLNAVVVAGGSRELLTAVHRVLSDEAVSDFQATFSWAGSVAAPMGVPREVTLPGEASQRIDFAAKALKQTRVSAGETLTGLVVQLRDDPKEVFGEMAIQTVRQGRTVEVRVRVRAETREKAHDWMRDRRTIVCEGRIRRAVGQPLTIDEPTRVQPLDETFLSTR